MIWEARDIKVGQRVRKPGTREVWMIGYDASLPMDNLCLVSLSDGSIAFKEQSRGLMANLLNASGNQPVALIGEVDA